MTRRIAFITGASRGIGAATAVALAERGFDVAVTARTLVPDERHEHGNRADTPDSSPLPGSLQQTAEAIRERGREALPIRLDLLDRASIAAAVDETEQCWGPIELLVNNGIYQGPGTMDHFLELRLEDVEKIYQGNVLSQILLIQRVLPGMLARAGGTIVNLVSASGMSDPPAPAGQGGWGFGYSSSKAAFMRLVGVLAVEHPEAGLRLFNLEPGFILTEMMKQSDLAGEFESRFGGAPPAVPAAVIAWLATEPAADAWHGQTVFAQKLCAKLGLVPGWPPPRG